MKKMIVIAALSLNLLSLIAMDRNAIIQTVNRAARAGQAGDIVDKLLAQDAQLAQLGSENEDLWRQLKELARSLAYMNGQLQGLQSGVKSVFEAKKPAFNVRRKSI